MKNKEYMSKSDSSLQNKAGNLLVQSLFLVKHDLRSFFGNSVSEKKSENFNVSTAKKV